MALHYQKISKTHTFLLIAYVCVFIWSAIHPKDTFTWFLEVFPAIIALGVLIYTYQTFRLTPLTYWLICLHSIILMVGGHYTYAEVPLFDTIKELFNQSRNNYDKVGHFTQGFVPAIVAREILIRKQVILKKGWIAFIVVSICTSISAVYELLEWGVSLFSGESGDAFLGTQGYVWDTQSDMFLALIGAVTALVLLSKIHSRQISTLVQNK